MLLILIHEANPQSRPVVIIVFAHVVRLYVRPSLFKTKQNSNESNVRYWRDCVSGRVDHWWHTCIVQIKSEKPDAIATKISMIHSVRTPSHKQRNVWNNDRALTLTYQDSKCLLFRLRGFDVTHFFLFLTLSFFSECVILEYFAVKEKSLKFCCFFLNSNLSRFFSALLFPLINT